MTAMDLDNQLRRTRERLTKYGYGLTFSRDDAGWTWNIVGNPRHNPHWFDTPQQALENADRYTRLWFP